MQYKISHIIQSMNMSPIPIKNGLKTTNHEISECKRTLAINKIRKDPGISEVPHPKSIFTFSFDIV